MSDHDLTRRDFLKLVGAVASIGLIGKYVHLMDKSQTSIIPKAYAASSGSWSLGPNLSFAAIHVALLKNGKIMYVSGSGYHYATQYGPYTGTLFDPGTNTEVKQLTFTEDVFCCGFNQLENGNILVTGGTKDYDTSQQDGKWTGLNSAYEFDTTTENFYKVSSMAHGRWYPTQITHPDSKVSVFSGNDEFGDRNMLVEIYDPIFKNFSIKYDLGTNRQYCVGSTSTLPGAGTPCYGGVAGKGASPSISLYPHMILMPSGLLFRAGPQKALVSWNPADGRWIDGGSLNSESRGYCSSILLPLNNTVTERGRILIAGGYGTGSNPPLNTAEILDFNAGSDQNPTVNYTASMTSGRTYGLPIILPNGKVVIFGGTSDYNLTPQTIPEMFDPVTNTWSTLPAATVPRWYHSTAVLLPDGRVWTASGTPNRTNWEPRVEYFSPDYLFAGTRPVISGTPTVGSYGGTITIPTGSSNINSVSLLRLAATTHHFDNDMRFIWLQIQSSNSSSVTVSAPTNANIAPPGHYMIHVLNSAGIPSIGKIIKISHPSNSGPDTAAPYVGILKPSSNAVIGGPSNGVNVSITGTAFDSQSGVQDVKVAIDSGTPIIVTPRSLGDWSAWSFSGIINNSGSHTIRAIATDNQGNKASTTIPITIVFTG